jgi:hypothetical protein
MTIKAELGRGLDQVRIVSRSMNIVATKARDATTVHHALHEIIPLHPVLVTSAVGKMHECCFAQLVLLEPPKIPQVQSLLETNGPIVILALNGILQWLSLRVALNAHVVVADKVQFRWIDDI